MKFARALALAREAPLLSTGILVAGERKPAGVYTQVSRWVRTGRLLQIRRGLYAVAPPYARTTPHPFTAANHAKPASYVSLQSALAHHGVIPESVPAVTSVTAGRPEEVETPLGRFLYRHVKPGLFRGFGLEELGGGEAAFVATPEKALLDLVHLTPGADGEGYLRELRLDPGRIDREALTREAGSWHSPKIRRAAAILQRILDEGT